MPQPSTEVKGVSRAARPRGAGWAGALLLAGLIATAVAAWYTHAAVEGAAQQAFAFACADIQGKILDRLRAHEQILRSGAAFVEETAGGTREGWRHFTQRQQREQRLPGIQGLGVALVIPRANLAEHLRTIRAAGFPDYRVRPEGERDPYSAIVYLEPFTDRNLRAFGYDMLTEPVRRAAMERARDQDAAALSGRVVLVQETDTDVQAGTLMYVPVYRTGQPIATVAQRRAALRGWVYSPYRMTDLMQGILGGWNLAGATRIRLEVFDGEQTAPAALLYDKSATTPVGGGLRKPPRGGLLVSGGPRGPLCRRKDPPRALLLLGVFLCQLQDELLLNFLVLFLFSDVLDDLLLFESNGAHAVACGPEMESGEVLRPSQKLAVDPDRRLPLHPPDSGCDAVLRRNAGAQVYVIHHPVSLDHFDAALLADLPQDLADLLAQASEDGLLAVLRHDDNVVPAVPPHVRLALPLSHRAPS